ncbi:MAG: pyrroloquinoline quinone-dependent dehydrogenase, partial [Halieaceae bacterium]|nr:pyrroloquinoline quinone-dependent dehydrogenase [Halieaceae bacterium]
FSTATQVTPDNVAQLELAWTHRSGDIRQAGEPPDGLPQTSLQVTPIVIDDVLYYCTPFNRVFALDAVTGKERWVFDPGIDRNSDVLNHCRGVSSWRSPAWHSGARGTCEHRILLGTLDARLFALDAATGTPCRDFGDGGAVDTAHRLTPHEAVEYGITSPPVVVGELVITGAAVLDNIRRDAPAGVVRAYDVRSGELRWAWNPVPPGMAELDEDGNYRSGTTNVWSIISVDAARNLVFVPTGNSTPDFFGGHRRGEEGAAPLDFYSSAVVALDADSGNVVWHFQTVHHDIWDYDVPAQPTLVDLQVGGRRVPAVVQVTKTGRVFALHRETGEPLWPVEERPAPQQGAAPGEYLAATQPFPMHVPPLVSTDLRPEDAWGLTPWDRGACRKRIAALVNEGIFTPPSLQGSLHFPFSGGGNNWGSPSIHPDSNLMVVYTMHVPGYARLRPREQCADSPQPQLGTPYCIEAEPLLSPLGVPCSAPPWGTLDGIDLVSGEIKWRVPMGTTRDLAPFPFWFLRGLPGVAAPLMTASGLVFSGISDEHALRAFDAASGEELWHRRLPTAANALPMSYVAGGRQFVVVAAGGHWSASAPPGDHIMAFALPTP